ncbi:hypothetical protein [Kalamiella sp. sgz302252]|uniref:hypothetical protein n=1 Tax=Pantoea sp. sgz302252 TaxID=3341827 RepID=UPI0036D27775
MKKILTFLTIYIAVSILYALPADIITDDNLHGYSIVEMQNLGIPKNLRMISVEDLEKELRSKPPMAVGFDIDDTVIFS